MITNMDLTLKLMKKRQTFFMNTTINKNKQILQVTPFIGPTLFSLFQKGIGE